MTKHSADTRYEVITQEDPETGDLFLPLPPELLERMGWTIGDTLLWSTDEQGRWVIRREAK